MVSLIIVSIRYLMLNKGSKEKKYKTMQEKIQMTKLNQNLSMRNFRTETLRMKTSESTLTNLICHKIFLFHVVNFTISLII